MSKITIANPIYDVVFKYLLEDLEIAKGLISRILDCEIESLEVHSQETSQETLLSAIPGLRLLRLDFKAVIWVKKVVTEEEKTAKKVAKKKATTRTKEEKEEQEKKEEKFERKKVLIELQKSKELFDILRFRKYLAENYAKSDTVMISSGKNETEILPIVTIYFLGFRLENIPFAVLKVEKKLMNVLENKVFELSLKEDFVDLLTHESYTIQISRLNEKLQNPLENILSIFNQKYSLKGDKHRLFLEENIGDSLVNKAQSRLARAAGDEDFRKKMDVEDEMERTVLRKFREFEMQLEEANAKIEEANAKMEEANAKMEEEKQRAEEAEKLAEEEKKRLNEAERLLQEQQAKINALLKQLNDKKE